MSSRGWVPRRTGLDEQEQQPVVARLRTVLGALVVEDHATRAQAAVARWSERAAFTVEWEVLLDCWTDGRLWRLDLLASRGQLRLAIELDARVPRAKSIRNLPRGARRRPCGPAAWRVLGCATTGGDRRRRFA